MRDKDTKLLEEASWSVYDKERGTVRNRTSEEIQQEVEAIKRELRQIPEKKRWAWFQREMRNNQISIPALKYLISFIL